MSKKNNRLPVYVTNEFWASRVLQLPHIPGNNGPDLRNKDVFVEVKSGIKRGNWTLVGEKQINYSRGYTQDGFLLLVLYTLNKDPRVLKTVNLNALENCVGSRSGYLLPFDQVLNLEVSNGQEDCYAYPDKLLKSTRVISSYSVEKGTLHICEGVNHNRFNIQGKRLEIPPS